jgi:hypothetical protein
MARLGLADRDDLAQWGRAEGAPADLPRLVRRLILETAQDLVQVGFAAGVGVFGSDWDGTARASSATAKVPAGLSLWELSTRGAVNSKADADFDKRTTTPDGTPATDAAYVAVSTRTWRDRHSWAREKTALARWREVRAYGVDDLETWLEDAPVTWAWISETLGLQPHGLITAEGWWDTWSHATEPALPPKAILSGRDEVADALRKALGGPGGLITVSGASRDDVLAFVAALAVTEAATDGGALLARAAYLDKVEAYRRWRDLKRPLVLAPLNEDVAAAMTDGAAHHLVVPVESGRADHALPPLDAQAASVALQEAGLDEARADEVGQIARLSLLAGRRRIAVKPELHRPHWARPPIDRLVRRIILLGRFSDNADADKAIAARALGSDYAVVSEALTALTLGEDPLLARLGASFGVVSHIDAWLLVGDHVRKDDVEAFHAAALEVLTESDPRQELAPHERWQASILGKERLYSHDLRRGVATTLALMGAYGDVPVAAHRLTAREWAAWIVRQILEAANGDPSCRLWASLDDVITLLAEAAPDEFIAAARVGLSGNDPLLAKLFTDDRKVSGLFGGSSHSGLLWALETCSWSPEHFGAVVELLARWAEVDPGGSYGNRPHATLTDFFRAWFPQTSVSPERRIDIIDGLRKRHPEIAWPLLLSLLPHLHGHATNIAAPRFRTWKQPHLPKTNGDVASFYEAVFARALEDAGADPERLVPLVDQLPTLPPTGRETLFDRLADIRDALDEEARTRLWAVMRAEAAKNREYATAVWALAERDVDRIETIAATYEPLAAATRLRWLFDEHLPSLPNVDRSDGFGEYSAAIATARAEAAAQIAAEGDWARLEAFARSVELVWFFGAALAQAGVHEYERHLLALLGSDDSVDINLASSYFSQRFHGGGWQWLDELLGGERLSARHRARLLLATNDFPKAWERLPDDEVRREFWKEFRPIGLGADFAHVPTVVRELYAVDRYGAGLDLLNLYLRDDMGSDWAELVVEGLGALLDRESGDELRQLSQYGLRNLFSYLERVLLDDERLARLEWAYLPAFEFEPAPPTLSRYLARDPSFFVDVVSRVFKPGDEDSDHGDSDGELSDDETDESDERTIEIARNGYRLLSEWRTLPGEDGGSVDGEVLSTWIDEARAGLREARRLRVGDSFIGKLLAASPPDADGAWPCLAVRDVLEAVESERMEQGMATEIFNSLGVTSRGVLDGGEQERSKGAVYREQAQRFVDLWPKTAALLRDAAETFERVARDRDADAERRRTGFDT